MIFVNDNTPSHKTMRGTSRYVRKVIDGIVSDFGELATIFSANDYGYAPAHFWRAPAFRGARRLGVPDAVASLLAVRARVAYSTFFGRLRTRAAEAFTVYDMTWEHSTTIKDATGFSRRELVEKRSCMERAELLLSISKSTATDILEIYPSIDSKKIVVTPLGVDEFFLGRDETPQVPDQARKPYFLFAGYRENHKNFMRLLQAYGQSGLSRNVGLIAISPGEFEPEELEIMETYAMRDCVHLIPRVTELDLRRYYTQAVALVYPSTREGFGLPIIEAMASGSLVGTSNVSCMPEIGGTAAFYFDPYDVESISETLKVMAGLPQKEREARIELSIAHARTFTWAECQQRTTTALRQLS